MPGRRLDVRCFLEGIQVPFLGAEISITTNQASSATVNVVATNTIFDIRPKTHVLLMFWDEAGDGTWRLLWEGQVLGIGYSKAPDTRAATLQCRDLSNYWDYLLRAMVDGISATTLHTEKLHFFGNGDALVRMSMESASNYNFIFDAVSGGKTTLPEALLGLLQGFTDKIPSYEYVNKAYKINKQIQMKEDKSITKLISATLFQDYLRSVNGRSTGLTPVRDVILSFCQMIYYNIVSIPSAPYIDGLKTFLLKPNLYGTLPPACNVILPDICTSVNYQRNFMAEPTRMMLRTSSFPGEKPVRGITPTLQPSYVVPEEVFSKINSVDEEYKGAMTAEEREKGILPAEAVMGYSEVFASLGVRSDDKSKEARKKIMATLDYRFQLARYSNRTLTSVMELNPWLVCNFPCAIFDTSRSYIGVIANIHHSISASGGGHTSIDCNLAYEIADPSDPENAEQAPVFPGWMNDLYTPKNVNATYQGILGCKAIEGDTAASIKATTPDSHNSSAALQQDGKQVAISEHVLTLFNPFDKNADTRYRKAERSNSTYSFADKYRRRNIATLKNLYEFYGLKAAEAIPQDVLPNKIEAKGSSEYFLPSRVAVIKKYMDDPDVGIRASRALDGR